MKYLAQKVGQQGQNFKNRLNLLFAKSLWCKNKMKRTTFAPKKNVLPATKKMPNYFEKCLAINKFNIEPNLDIPQLFTLRVINKPKPSLDKDAKGRQSKL